MIRIGAFLIFLAFVSAAGANDLCDYYKRSNPDLYKLVCAGGSGGNSAKPAGANSTFSSAFNLSAASLPTEPSSYGLETLVHQLRTPAVNGSSISPTFSLVKGFQKFGTGISTGSNATFYGDDITQRSTGKTELDTFEPAEPAKGSIPNLNIGTAVSLFAPKTGPSVRLGLSARYNKITNTWGGGPALLLGWTHFSLGAGYTREKVSNFAPRLTFTSFQASVRYWILEAEYDRLDDDSSLKLGAINIYTLTATIKRLILTAAHRELAYYGRGNVSQNHFAVQFLFSQHFSAGILYNYIPGATSLGAQYFL